MPHATPPPIRAATRGAALDCGGRRTTLTDIARRAGVSRMTVYRRYPDVDAVLLDLMTREFGASLEATAAAAVAEAADGRERLRLQIVAGLAALRAHPLMRKVVEAEPERLLPYMLGRLGASQRHALVLLTAAVAAGQADGSIRAGDPELMARALLLCAQSFLFLPEDDAATAALDGELGRIVDAMLASG
ncbi:MAG: TetR/AcrR family transcriptional regulator [Baekduiaceae bacterium]